MKTTLNVNFTKNNTNKKDEVILEFQVRGELTDEQIVKLARLKSAGSIVIDIRSSQADLDDYEEPREGIRGTINSDGTLDLQQKEEGQLTLDEVQEQADAAAEESDNQEQTDDESEELEGEDEEQLPADEDNDDLE